MQDRMLDIRPLSIFSELITPMEGINHVLQWKHNLRDAGTSMFNVNEDRTLCNLKI